MMQAQMLQANANHLNNATNAQPTASNPVGINAQQVINTPETLTQQQIQYLLLQARALDEKLASPDLDPKDRQKFQQAKINLNMTLSKATANRTNTTESFKAQTNIPRPGPPQNANNTMDVSVSSQSKVSNTPKAGEFAPSPYQSTRVFSQQQLHNLVDPTSLSSSSLYTPKVEISVSKPIGPLVDHLPNRPIAESKRKFEQLMNQIDLKENLDQNAEQVSFLI